ncbi:thioredoxin domain-containing protein [Pelagicoccus mobilis]|uniref:Thioredoxin domain-containing protein n=1 Tax=Pelagicoccus mobilis TaxID=415221 RepID=A0A934RYY4_9BACT|nr:thioredoxin domain-containing protein [Pelagicoccus mobilis]MBK1876078.1 thioredoxin domain-containing protein [Pelagicoccus mobilis]
MPRLTAIFLCLSLTVGSAHAANRLADSQSPYLQQHADNPVDWYPWGPEAFEKAEAEQKLVFISVGYSTCHWCHVMNRESFSDEEIAAYLNENYVCIKIDREERPDIDNVYMTFVQTLTGQGGWPLNVWLTPDKKPFFGGTYFPPRDDPRRGRGFLPIIQNINKLWKQDPASMLARSTSMVETLNQHSPESSAAEGDVSLDLITSSISASLFAFDEENKGFGEGQKFPGANSLSLLLRAAATPEIADEDRALAKRMGLETLDAIITGGIRDHVGGGFHRYTVDAGWQLPHFEKMLYDQALIVEALIDAWQLTGEDRYKQATIETLDYLLREMRDPAGGFYSAEDAESDDPDAPGTKREGAYFLWSVADFETLFPAEETRAALAAYFNVRPAGNAPYGNFPRDIFQGYNTLRINSVKETIDPKTLEEGLNTLREARSKRKRPHLDDKIITSWNGLAISALARAGLVFERDDYTAAAQQAATFILENLYDAQTGTLARLYRKDVSPVSGFAEDYAFIIDGLLDLYEATADHTWIQQAKRLQDTQDQRFADSDAGGFFLFEASEDIVFKRTKFSADSAIPSPNSVSAKNLARLSQFFDDSTLADRAAATIAAFSAELESAGTYLPTLREAALLVSKKPLQIVIAGTPDSKAVDEMLREMNHRLLPSRILLYADQGQGQAYLGEHLEFIQTAKSYDDLATAFVCENFVCQMPTEDPKVLAKQLDAKR